MYVIGTITKVAHVTLMTVIVLSAMTITKENTIQRVKKNKQYEKKTIEQRAKERLSDYSDSCCLHKSEETEESYLDGFFDGAISQRKIDIDKACKAYCKVCDTKECEEYGCIGECDWVEHFRDTLEKLCPTTSLTAIAMTASTETNAFAIKHIRRYRRRS